jgi:hypothetical protein
LIKAGLSHPFVWYFFLLILVGVVLLSGACCSRYNPSLYPSYDVLNPGPEVRLNPLSFTADGNLIVNTAFIAWVEELKQEIIKLRKAIK